MGQLNQGQWSAVDSPLKQADSFKTAPLPQAGRYHLYMSYACPWAHRVFLTLSYLGLLDKVSVSSVDPHVLDDGWPFSEAYPDPLYNLPYLRDVYLKAKADYTGRVDVPCFWDKQEQTIASNDSAFLAVTLAQDWLELASNPVELVPAALKEQILELNQWLNANITSKVYAVGVFAGNQATYDKRVEELFASLAELDQRLSQQKYLFGEEITVSDFFLFPTLIRFEAVYADLFKCNLKPLSSFTNLYRYMLDLYSIPSIKATVDIAYIKEHYYFRFNKVNPSRIVPAGPYLPWLEK
ncbi:glutathione-dependent reductase [Psittacicella melopsittaci]|uniref:Glutathione-dependent reductase n=1 Tax=Psittacicella melopsittaci TaxID=2028576 RepID=A0A3A1Y8N3_9GAMM|nr:glutathione S-transferase C-terminal domain-containing protein [Psittacicella melopsittaci]RIY34025.1 glutathione-dependent reductase [Psittacicella melopsittaci]